MLSNLASYLWGDLKAPVVNKTSEGATAEVKIGAIDVDDWVLVEKTIEKNGNVESDVEYECWPTVELTMSTVPPTIFPEPSMEESWFVTPPPCFTSEGPIIMEMSPLENLLIEHPSMSVYRHSVCLSVDEEEEQQEEKDPAPSPVVTIRPILRVRAVTAHSLQVQQEESKKLKTAQKVWQQKATENIKRNQLQRNNKAREIDSRNKVRRRSDRMLRHSGANNNRKCC